MYGDSSKPPIGSSKLLLIFVAAIIVVMVGTIVLNGGVSTSTTSTDNQEVSNSSNVTDEAPSAQYKLIGNNSYGTVTKISGLGDSASDIKVALILGVDSQKKSANAILPTLQNEDMLNYCYDVYVVNASDISNATDENNSSNLTVNGMSESLASEFVVPDIIKNNYNFTVDVHSTNDSNSYVYVPSENTYTSKIVVDKISNNTNVGKYTPDKHSYTESLSEKVISYQIPSIVYVTKEYYNDGISSEISSVINTIDQFDFLGLFNGDLDVSTSNSTSDSDVSTSNSTSGSNGNSSNDTKVVYVSNSSGNVEVN